MTEFVYHARYSESETASPERLIELAAEADAMARKFENCTATIIDEHGRRRPDLEVEWALCNRETAATFRRTAEFLKQQRANSIP